ncbi:MAG: ABC transporter ATP-binding protein [Rhizobiales bacterium PAR1]|nr:MAG: ABC transporter ATP-binding protein [Rhizobiales bacterium PAR1]
MTFLSLDRLTKRFGDHIAVNGISLDVAKGEFISLLGPSGCGKTTTLQMIAGFLDLSEGAIRLDGRDLARVKPAERGLGIVFQSYALFPHMTAAQNVAFGLEMRGVARPEREVRVREALKLVGLAGYEDRFPRRMSGGQQQRVALARAIVIRPQVLLLDEPLSNLDAKLREEMQIELRLIQRNLGTTTILVTHDQHEAMALSDRIVVMNKGVIEQVGTPLETYERPASAFVAQFLGKTNEFSGLATVAGGITVGGFHYPAPPGLSGAVTVFVRPERITFAIGASGVAGRVEARIFQGNHWLYQIATEAGRATLIRQNDGSAVPDEGAEVRLVWRAEDAAVRAGSASNPVTGFTP